MNVDFGKFAQIAQTYSGRGIDQTARRRDNEHAANSLRRAGKGIGVSKFAAKIESAEKGELAYAKTFARTAEGICGVLVIDRKSTRLNSSHTVISYAVFC